MRRDGAGIRDPDQILHDRRNESACIQTIEGKGGAIDRFIAWQSGAIGRDINPDKLRRADPCPDWEGAVGAYRVDVILPVFTPLGPTSAKFPGPVRSATSGGRMKTTTLEFLKAAGIYAQRSCRTGAGRRRSRRCSQARRRRYRTRGCGTASIIWTRRSWMHLRGSWTSTVQPRLGHRGEACDDQKFGQDLSETRHEVGGRTGHCRRLRRRIRDRMERIRRGAVSLQATTSYLLQDTETVERFRALVAKAKRASTRLDTIEFAQDGTATAYAMTRRVGMTVTNAGFAAKIGYGRMRYMGMWNSAVLTNRD